MTGPSDDPALGHCSLGPVCHADLSLIPAHTRSGVFGGLRPPVYTVMKLTETGGGGAESKLNVLLNKETVLLAALRTGRA